MYKMVYLIRAKKLDQRCVNQLQAPCLASDLKTQINISCYTEYKAFGPSLIYNIMFLTQKLFLETLSLTHLDNVYDTLYVQEIHNLTLPDWTRKVYPHPMIFLHDLVKCLYYLPISFHWLFFCQQWTGRGRNGNWLWCEKSELTNQVKYANRYFNFDKSEKEPKIIRLFHNKNWEFKENCKNVK